MSKGVQAVSRFTGIRLQSAAKSILLFASLCLVYDASFARKTSGIEKPGSSALPWSFRPIADPILPSVKDKKWERDPLDRFILAKMEVAGIRPNRDADRATLLRRISFDLTGLPPQEAEVAAFLADRSSDDQAFAKVVDRLLNSSHFGERWARHWLDVVRYADSIGRNWNSPFNYAFRYRDYVIDALNKDKPYDRFIYEQLAGDMLTAKSVAERRENLTALGMLALGSLDLQALSREQFDLDTVDDQIDVVSRAMLGLTISCARCHDHKYDPVSMRDYYALAGIFYSTKILPGVSYLGRGNGYVDHERLVVLPIAAKSGQTIPAISSGLHSMDDYQEAWSRGGKRDIRFTTDPNLAMSARDDEIADCALRIKGDPNDRGPTPPRGDVKIPGLPPMTKPPSNASGRRELAKWIASPQHPLTARVMTNRIWLHLFGQGLVETPDDFGLASEPPSHPELLDHLATRFVTEKWSIKTLIKSIVCSRTYRLSSTTRDNPAQETDAQNKFYWRSNLRRLEFEPLRDSLLAVSGQLTTDRPDGIQVKGIGGKSPKSQVTALIDVDSTYRTIYLPVVRSNVAESFNTFDFPDPCQILGRRDVTTVAPQALFFMNSRFVSGCAADTAERALDQKLANPAATVRWLYRQLFGREATAEEIRAAESLIADLQSPKNVREKPIEAWTTLAQALMASAEFRYVR